MIAEVGNAWLHVAFRAASPLTLHDRAYWRTDGNSPVRIARDGATAFFSSYTPIGHTLRRRGRRDLRFDEPPGPVKLLRHIQQHADFYRVMLGSKGDLAFTERFRQNTERRFRSWAQDVDMSDAPPFELRIKYASYAGIGAIVWWLEHGQHISPEQLASWLSHISAGFMGKMVKSS